MLNRANLRSFLNIKYFNKYVMRSFADAANKNVIEYADKSDWDRDVLKAEGPVVVDCYADWCGPCVKLMPQLVKRAGQNEKVKLIKVNIDNNSDIAEKLNVSSIPAVFVFHKGKVVDQFVGAPNEQALDKFFEKVKNLH